MRDEFDQLKNQRSAAQATINELNQQAASQRESSAQQISDLRNQQTQLLAQISTLQSQNSGLVAEVESLKQDAALHTAQIDQFLATSETYAQLNGKQSDELGQLRAEELENARREIALLDRINELEGRLEVSEETNRSLQERLVELREDLEFAQQGGSTGVARSEGNLKAPVGFRATVTGVSRDQTGSTLVEIDAGTSDNLKENMKLNIVGSSGYIASAVVQLVDDNSAVVRVTVFKPGRENDLRAGNIVQPTL